MRTTGLRVVVVVVGVALLVLLVAIATNQREVVAYVRGVDGSTSQVPLTCAGIAEGGGLVDAGEPTVVDAAPEGVVVLEPSQDFTEACPEEGPVWLGVLGLLGVLVAGGTVWAWQYLGHRARSGRPGGDEPYM